MADPRQAWPSEDRVKLRLIASIKPLTFPDKPRVGERNAGTHEEGGAPRERRLAKIADEPDQEGE